MANVNGCERQTLAPAVVEQDAGVRYVECRIDGLLRTRVAFNQLIKWDRMPALTLPSFDAAN